MIAFISLGISFIIFLFIFYYYARDDFYFIRKGVSMEQLFNVLFSGLFVGVISSRLMYFLLDLGSQEISSITPFFASRTNGISVFGGLVGLFLTYSVLTKRRKINKNRFFDYVTIATLGAFPIIFLGVSPNLYLFIMYLMLFVFFIFILIPKYIKGKMRPGSISLFFLIMVSLISFLQDIFLLYTKNILLSKESFLFLALFLLSCLLIVRLEMKKSVKA